jgi:hypothetical protein
VVLVDERNPLRLKKDSERAAVRVV